LFGQFAQVKTAPAQHRLGFKLVLLLAVLCLASLAAGSQGFSPREFWSLLSSPDAALLIGQIRAPRTLGAALVGALLGLAGATAQGLFRNPLADPYLLGSASGASLGVVLVLTASALLGQNISLISANMLLRLGLVGAAFIGAVLGVVLTLVLARGTQQTARLLLAGVIVGVVLSGMGDVLTHQTPCVPSSHFCSAPRVFWVGAVVLYWSWAWPAPCLWHGVSHAPWTPWFWVKTVP
jgi:iron complex transport system permease protein